MATKEALSAGVGEEATIRRFLWTKERINRGGTPWALECVVTRVTGQGVRRSTDDVMVVRRPKMELMLFFVVVLGGKGKGGGMA